MLEDPATYEALADGDRFLSGFVQGFEVVPYPYLAPVEGLPSEVKNAYSGPSLFRHENGQYIANYQESMDILEYLFPKDKNIFLMCGGGGYAGMTKAMLVSLGWDENKIYNTGGYWYYEGENAVIVKNDKYKDSYDFWKVPYHNINFKELHEVK
jgi:rhodanese-related sulfurtransferase